ncbi:hypothetical protein [Maribellus sediminis]|uniref:hypothetical protein n=1 Tax=Maribellus sediminis TaxID=2696285 RepID=UPI001430BB19|nr:hypothetical protein [Maribellus sediminis]
MTKIIVVNQQVMKIDELEDITYGPLVGQVLQLAGLDSVAEKYDEFIHQMEKGTRQELVTWISQNSNIGHDQARIGFKKFLLIWGLGAIMIASSFQRQLEVLKHLTHSFVDVISPDKTKISIMELQKIILEEGIEAYEAYDFTDGFCRASQKYFSILI